MHRPCLVTGMAASLGLDSVIVLGEDRPDDRADDRADDATKAGWLLWVSGRPPDISLYWCMWDRAGVVQDPAKLGRLADWDVQFGELLIGSFGWNALQGDPRGFGFNAFLCRRRLFHTWPP